MASEFNRILALLRKERGITQKQAAADLGISQAQLSHYEKGIRECSLAFVVQVADYYGVSCDYLLGRSADRSGQTISVADLPETGASTSGSVYRGSVLPTMYKKLIENSLDILYDKLQESKDKQLVIQISQYLMLAVYKVFRRLYDGHVPYRRGAVAGQCRRRHARGRSRAGCRPDRRGRRQGQPGPGDALVKHRAPDPGLPPPRDKPVEPGEKRRGIHACAAPGGVSHP